MARETAQERTEQATPKRLREARQRGMVPRSRELNSLALLLAGAAAVAVFGPTMVARVEASAAVFLSPDPSLLRHPWALQQALQQALLECLLLLLPLLATALVVAGLAPMLLGGWSFSSEALGFKFQRIDPMAGLKRMVSRQALVELFKALAKFVVVAGVLVVLLWGRAGEVLALGGAGVIPGIASTGRLLVGVQFVLILPLLLLALADVPFQLWNHARQLRMSRQEVKDEAKETEGHPEVKARIKRVQQQLAQQRMMQDVPKADVVIANPTNYSVALRYSEGSMAAPVVVARGVDQIALTIRSIANNHSVPVVVAPPLARSLYRLGKLGKPIPETLYVAVAQVLAYLYQLRAAGESTLAPIPMEDLDLPTEGE